MCARSNCGAWRRRVDQLDGVLQHRHHAEAEQIDLDDAHVGAVVLVPLDDDAARHAGGLERHDRVELALADHHAARVLAEMARQVLDAPPQLGERRACAACRATGRRLRGCAPSVSFGSVNSKLCITLASRSICVVVERQRLAHFARGAAAAIGDDVGGHRRAQRGRTSRRRAG